MIFSDDRKIRAKKTCKTRAIWASCVWKWRKQKVVDRIICSVISRCKSLPTSIRNHDSKKLCMSKDKLHVKFKKRLSEEWKFVSLRQNFRGCRAAIEHGKKTDIFMSHSARGVNGLLLNYICVQLVYEVSIKMQYESRKITKNMPH